MSLEKKEPSGLDRSNDSRGVFIILLVAVLIGFLFWAGLINYLLFSEILPKLSGE